MARVRSQLLVAMVAALSVVFIGCGSCTGAVMQPDGGTGGGGGSVGAGGGSGVGGGSSAGGEAGGETGGAPGGGAAAGGDAGGMAGGDATGGGSVGGGAVGGGAGGGCPAAEPNYKRINGQCVPSCGVAGANTCLTNAMSNVCDGQERRQSWDCEQCCVRCDRLPPRVSGVPVIHYYGFFPSGTPNVPDDALNRALLVPGLEVIFAVAAPPTFDVPGWSGPATAPGGGPNYLTGTDANYPTCGAFNAEFTKWRSLGAKLGKRITNEQLQAWLDDGTAANRVEKILRYGWDYVVIDEIGGVAWRDTQTYGQAVQGFLSTLAARGLSGRMIFWVNPSTTQISKQPTAAEPTGAIGLYQALLQACETKCKRVVFETYPFSNTAAAPCTNCITTSSVMAGSSEGWLEWLAQRISNTESGANLVSLSGLGTSNVEPIMYLDQPGCDIACSGSHCKGNCPANQASGGLHQQFSKLHQGTARNQCGVAFYGHSRLVDTAQYTRADFVNWLRTETSWWVNNPCTNAP